MLRLIPPLLTLTVALCCLTLTAQKATDAQQDAEIQSLESRLEAVSERTAPLEPRYIALPPKPRFVPLDIPLSEELQQHTWEVCEEYGAPFGTYMAILENESGFIWPGSVMDTNGYHSVGYAQINEPCWAYLLEEYGLDVHNERDNLKAGVALLAEFLAKYPLEKALVCYQCGEAGAKGKESTEFSRKILERSEVFAR